MKENTLIYIILLALLLYLYYKRRDLTIILVFIVLLGSTLIFSNGIREGAKGGRGGGDCSKLGFTSPKINKKDIKGSLEKIFNNFKKVTEKYVIYEEKNIQPKDDYKEAIEAIAKMNIIKTEMEKVNKTKENGDYMMAIVFGTYGLILPYIMKPSEDEQKKFINETLEKFNKKNDKNVDVFTMIIKGADLILDVLNNIKKSDEMKDASKEAKSLISASICACKQVLSVWKQLQKSSGGGGDGDDDDKEDKKDDEKDDDEDSGKKKKKKETKKKKKSSDDGGDDE